MSEPKTSSKKLVPILIAVGVITAVMAVIGTFLFTAAMVWMESAFLTIFFIVYALLYAAIIVGVIAALSQRLREIDNGEEDEASKY